MVMQDITREVSVLGYKDKNCNLSSEPIMRLRDEKAVYTCLNTEMGSVNLIDRFIGRLCRIESDDMEPRVTIALRNVSGDVKTLEGVLYGTTKDLKVYTKDLKKVEF